MRGDDQQQNHMFSYLSPEMRVRKIIRCAPSERWWTKSLLNSPGGSTRCTPGGPTVDCAGAVVASAAAADAVLDPQRALADGRDGLQPAVSLVCGAERGCDVWDATVFTKNRDRLLEADIATEFLARVVEQARTKGLMSDEHFTVDGTLLEAWASVKSFQPKDGNSRRRTIRAIPR